MLQNEREVYSRETAELFSFINKDEPLPHLPIIIFSPERLDDIYAYQPEMHQFCAASSMKGCITEIQHEMGRAISTTASEPKSECEGYIVPIAFMPDDLADATHEIRAAFISHYPELIAEMPDPVELDFIIAYARPILPAKT